MLFDAGLSLVVILAAGYLVTIAPIIGAILGGGSLVAFFKVRSENALLRAKAASVANTSIQEVYGHVLEDLQIEIARIRINETECKAALVFATNKIIDLQTEVFTLKARVVSLEGGQQTVSQDIAKLTSLATDISVFTDEMEKLKDE